MQQRKKNPSLRTGTLEGYGNGVQNDRMNGVLYIKSKKKGYGLSMDIALLSVCCYLVSGMKSKRRALLVVPHFNQNQTRCGTTPSTSSDPVARGPRRECGVWIDISMEGKGLITKLSIYSELESNA